MTPEERQKLNICPKCGKPTLRFMVSMTISAPMEMLHNLTRANLRKASVHHWGTYWDKMDVLCSNDEGCGYTRLARLE